MRRTAAGRGAFSPGCSGNGDLGAGPGPLPAGGAFDGGGGGSGLRPVPHPALPPSPAFSGGGAGPCVLAGDHGGPVSLRPDGGKRGGAALPGPFPLFGRAGIFFASQPVFPENRLLLRRPVGANVTHIDHAVSTCFGAFEKNSENRKKNLSFRGAMV